MHRRKAIIGAATVAGSLLAASSAYALTGGIVTNHGGDGAGKLSPVLDMAPTGRSTAPVPPATTRDEVEHRARGTEPGTEPADVVGREDDD